MRFSDVGREEGGTGGYRREVRGEKFRRAVLHDEGHRRARDERHRPCFARAKGNSVRQAAEAVRSLRVRARTRRDERYRPWESVRRAAVRSLRASVNLVLHDECDPARDAAHTFRVQALIYISRPPARLPSLSACRPQHHPPAST